MPQSTHRTPPVRPSASHPSRRRLICTPGCRVWTGSRLNWPPASNAPSRASGRRGYLTGLLSNTERKNSWQVAELAGEATPDGMQRLLSTAHWDADAVQGDLVADVMEQLVAIRPPCSCWMRRVFVKKGKKSVGAAPQYCGAVGKIANCQIGVFLAYATRHGPVLLDRELYLPQEWADDPTRRAEAGVPTDARCVPKPTLGMQLLERAFARRVAATWVTADSISGGAYKLRHYLEEREQPFVLAVQSTQRVGLSAKAEQVVASWPAGAWSRLSAGEGSQGPRWYDWAWMPMSWRDAPAGMAHWLLARRSLSKPDELAHYFVFGPASPMLDQVVRVAGTCWQVEQAFELAKGEVGLDEDEARTWVGWSATSRWRCLP